MGRRTVATPTVMTSVPPASYSSGAYTTLTSRLRSAATAAAANAAVATRRGALGADSPPLRGCVGTGGSSPALFRPTRVARIPPQLARFLIAGSAALLQVFMVAYQRESQKLRQEEQARGAVGSAQDSTGIRNPRAMSAMEAMQVLGLDRRFPDVYTSVQQAEARSTSTSALLPLAPGEARRAAQLNFERMFGLAAKEGNAFLAGKLSAAYRICVDPSWDQAMSGEDETADANTRSTTAVNAGEQGRSL
ncbi:conserved hypothetical protein [Leishmania infantum JPCM5]|uniref:Uncharacterized protein n=4 Tax=Leishmania donovani species complex TaxID=38574 RepID=A4IBC3_LEIIN|nr:conserved hypothetical protein [Leishmania infantum JPCM5]XP_003864815.1 hypothetical protein, conserved [Leishmania donovani]CAC9544811.1 hypothetical_protein_-_conserved [Leishmania infantum]AYU83035.1 hypothetical protein LdCL_350028500 [Leishmania donovani]CAM72139.1 conserved hypothetical protein [Leishmania infantum JPCM5]CBZ38135.1 hypothetical protein, conserved [Leishmania donovani]SUZ46061.1 hypothetical_protein_-_conserved [Leishmania infantum]|eukprot:XP_001469042.1 conserved hypothetical protein [Leishmania infantum JPCM5]